MSWLIYSNDLKFLDRLVQANITDPDQKAPTRFAILYASFGSITVWLNHIVQILRKLHLTFCDFFWEVTDNAGAR